MVDATMPPPALHRCQVTLRLVIRHGMASQPEVRRPRRYLDFKFDALKAGSSFKSP